jgi:pimeloyl-ACP methyl ester carboxylesterase
MTISPSAERGGGKYASVNGIELYYEIHGAGQPLVLIHGGGSTIKTTFENVLPLLARNHTVIAVEMQAHGHTSDRNAPESFSQDAADVAELLRQLNIERSDIFGFSNGGHTALELGMRHPGSVRKLIIASAFYKREGVPPAFWEGMERAQFSNMPQVYKDEFLKINNDAAALRNMFDRDVERMHGFTDWKEEELRSIGAPALVVIGDRDLPTPEHAVEMFRLLPHARLAILPGTHGSYMGEAMSADTDSEVPKLFVAMIEEFLAELVN